MSLNYPVIQRLGNAVPVAADIVVDTSSFANNLGAGDADVQAALDAIDDLAISFSTKAIRNETADYTIVATDYSIVIDAGSNAVEVLLPAAPTTGQVFNIACYDSTFAATINFNGKEFFKSTSDETLFEGENLTIQYNGTYWVSA